MSTVTFDTLKFVKTLEASGINTDQAEAPSQPPTETPQMIKSL